MVRFTYVVTGTCSHTVLYAHTCRVRVSHGPRSMQTPNPHCFCVICPVHGSQDATYLGTHDSFRLPGTVYVSHRTSGTLRVIVFTVQTGSQTVCVLVCMT